MTSAPFDDVTDRVPCATCRAPVDPLRAPFAAVIDERYRFYCSRECRERNRPATSRVRASRPPSRAPKAPRPSVMQTVDMLGLSRASLPPQVLDGGRRRPTPEEEALARRARALDEPADPSGPAVCVTSAAFALLLASMTSVPVTARLVMVSLCALGSLSVAGREVVRMRRDAAFFGWLTGWLGALVVVLAAARDHGPDAVRAMRDAAVLATLGPVLAWTARTRRAAGQSQMELLRRALPERAEVPRRAPATDDAPAQGDTETVETSTLRAGSEVVVGPGSVVPVDGVVRAGEAEVRLWPGARTARRRIAGDAVLAGARVMAGRLQVLATRAGDDVAWARLSRMMGAGYEGPRTVRLARRLERWTPAAVAGVALAVGLLHRYVMGAEALHGIGSVLSLAPLAWMEPLVEMPFIDALVTAARRGIVFRDAASVEDAAQVGTVALSMRGTVTTGRFELTEVVSLGRRSERELIALAAGVEEIAPGDPMGRAVLDAASARGWRPDSVRRPVVVPGQGITAVDAAGVSVVLGQRRLLLTEGISVAPGEGVLLSIEGAGRTTALLGIDGRLEGVLGFEDRVRDEARSAVQAMMDAGYDVAVVGGAGRATVEAIGAMLDVTNLRPEVLPEERPAVVRALSEMGNGVAVVGRAANDGASLAAADVAISMEAAGGAGTETSVALASDDLRDAAAALTTARRAQRRALTVMGIGLGGASVGALVIAAAPALSLVGVVAALALVLGGEMLALQVGRAEEDE